MKETFEPKSGMTFKSLDGKTGLFVGTERGLIMMYNQESKYTTYSYYNPEFLIGTKEYMIQEIHNGMSTHITEGLSRNISTLTSKVVWKREEVKTVKLNSEYTATIKGDVVTFGCTEIGIDKIKEILDEYNK